MAVDEINRNYYVHVYRIDWKEFGETILADGYSAFKNKVENIYHGIIMRNINK